MTGEIPCCYAVVPDGDDRPAAAFEDLEDALDWGLHHFGSDSFRVRHLRLMVAAPAAPRH